MKNSILAAIALSFTAPAAYAQSTATPVVTGYLTSSGCSYGQTTCFVQYGAGSGGTTVTANQGTANAGGANAWPVQVNAALPAGANVIGHVITDAGSVSVVSGTAAQGSAPSGNPVQIAGVATSTEPSLVNTTTMVDPWYDRVGKTVTSPYAAREVMVRGAASSTSNTAVSLIAAQGSSVKTYVSDLECGNTSATTVNVTFSDAVSTVLIVPAGGGFMKTFNVPLVTAANTAFTFTPSASATTVNCNAQGFTGY